MRDPLESVLLTRALYETAAYLLVAQLSDEGIVATVLGGNGASLFSNALGFPQVMVRQCDLARAEAFRASLIAPEGWEDEAESMPREEMSRDDIDADDEHV